MSSEERALQPVAEQLRRRVLEPYLDGCDYLRSATWWASDDGQEARLRARLAIERSCYIRETGHFNAVEANIAFNQMFYLLAAQAVEARMLAGFAGLTLADWLERQLPDVLIRDYEFHFGEVIDRRSFEGEMTFESVTPTRRFVVFSARCVFSDSAGGHAEGRSLLFFDKRERGLNGGGHA